MFTHWERYTLPDLREHFQIDAWIDSPDMERPWRWLRGHILSLVDIPQSRIARALEQ